jgi:hypothetical protein
MHTTEQITTDQYDKNVILRGEKSDSRVSRVDFP